MVPPLYRAGRRCPQSRPATALASEHRPPESERNVKTIEVVIVNEDGITVTEALADDVGDECLLNWADPSGEKHLFRLRHDIRQIWIEVGP